MLDARCWINKNKGFIFSSSISPRRRLYEPKARNQHLGSLVILHQNGFIKLDINFKIFAHKDTQQLTNPAGGR
jgi:hypothetical protein